MEDGKQAQAAVPASPAPPPPAPPLPPWLRLLPWAGGGLVLAIGLLVGLLALRGDPQTFPVAASLGALLYAGKEGGIPLGISLGASPFLVGLTLLTADVALTLLLFPPVLHGLDAQEGKRGTFGRVLRGARRRADKHRRLVDRYGAAGLFLFLLVPFAFNGPLVGAVMGRLAGLSPLQSLATVVGAIATTTIVWTSLYAYGFRALGFDPRLPILLSLCIASLVVGGSLWGAWTERRREARALVPHDPREA